MHLGDNNYYKTIYWWYNYEAFTGGSTTKPSTNDKLTVAANSGMAQIKPTNNGLYTTVYDKKVIQLTKLKKALSVNKTATLGSNKFYLVQDYNTGENLVGLNKVMLFITLLNHLLK